MKTILYVEDNEFNRKIVRQLLSRTSYRLIEANDGEAGVTTAECPMGTSPSASSIVALAVQLLASVTVTE